MPHPHPAESGARAVALVRAGKQAKQIAVELGIHPVTLSKWLRQDDINHGLRPGIPEWPTVTYRRPASAAVSSGHEPKTSNGSSDRFRPCGRSAADSAEESQMARILRSPQGPESAYLAYISVFVTAKWRFLRAPNGIRTHTWAGLSRLPLPVGPWGPVVAESSESALRPDRRRSRREYRPR